jgi:hypothetical protein
MNLYAYVNNDPVNAVDFRGLKVFFCRAQVGWEHAFVYLNESCAGLMPKGSPSIICGPSEIVKEDKSSADCIPKDVDDDPCCDQKKYESCVQREAIGKIGTSHSYGFSGIGCGNCSAWAKGVIIRCQKEACSK